jgi:hypothetical protein
VDSIYASEAIIAGLPGVAASLMPLFPLAHFARANRRLLACAPGIVSSVVFLFACVASGWTTHGAPTAIVYGYTILMVLAVALIAPSTLSLRNKWIGLVHLVTIPGMLFCWFVGGMAITHDWL